MLQSFQFLLAIRYYARNEFLVSNASFWSSLAVIKGVMLLLVAGNLAQIVIWGLLFVPVGELKDFGDAFYHSAVSFATLGCGAIVVSSEQGVLGPLKAVQRGAEDRRIHGWIDCCVSGYDAKDHRRPQPVTHCRTWSGSRDQIGVRRRARSVFFGDGRRVAGQGMPRRTD